MALPGRLDLDLYVGDTVVQQDTFTADDGVTPLPGVDFTTGHTFKCQVRQTSMRASALIATWTVTPVAANVLKRTLPAAEAVKLADAASDGEAYLPAWWDLEVTRTSDGLVRTYLCGKAKIKGDASR